MKSNFIQKEFHYLVRLTPNGISHHSIMLIYTGPGSWQMNKFDTDIDDMGAMGR